MTSSWQLPHTLFRQQVDGFVQDCSNPSALAMELLQYKPSKSSTKEGTYATADVQSKPDISAHQGPFC